MDDGQLIREYVRDRSESAFEQLVGRHLGMVYATALRDTGDAEAAEDVSQAVFLVLSQKGPRLKSAGSLAGWLFRTTRFAAVNVRQLEKRRARHERQAAEMRPEMTQQQIEQTWEKVGPELNAALGKLGSKEREAVILRYLEERSVKEVAEALGVSEAAAKMRIGRGLEKLRGLLGGESRLASVAALTTILETKGIVAVPAGLAGSITSAVLNGAAGATGKAWIIAKGAMNMMMWTRLKVAALVAATVLFLGGLSIVFSQAIGGRDASRPLASAAPPASQPATQPEDNLGGWTAEALRCASNMRNISQAVLRSANRNDHLPADLGATLRRVDRWSDMTADDKRPATLAEKAAMYICPLDQKDLKIPEQPTPDWVNKNTSYVYLGNAEVVLSKIPQDKWGSTVIVHDKLDRGHVFPKSGELFVAAYMDGHAVTLTKDQFKQAIAESLKTLEAAKDPSTKP